MRKTKVNFTVRAGTAFTLAFVFLAAILLIKPLHDVLTIPTAETSLEEYPAEVAKFIPDDPDVDDWTISLSMQEDGRNVDGGAFQWSRESFSEEKTFTFTVSYEKQATSARSYEPGEAVIVLNRFPLDATLHKEGHPGLPFYETVSADVFGSGEKNYDWSYWVVGDYYVFVNNRTIDADANVSGSLSISLRPSVSAVVSDIINGAVYEVSASINGKQAPQKCALECSLTQDRYLFDVSVSSPAASPKMEPEQYIYVMYSLSGHRSSYARPLLDVLVGRVHMPETKVFDSAMNQLEPDKDGGYAISNSARDPRDEYKFFMIVAYPRAHYENANITESFSFQGQFSPCSLDDFVGIGDWRDKIPTSVAATTNKTVSLRDFNLVNAGMEVSLKKWNYSINKTTVQTLDWFCITSPTHHSPSLWELVPKIANAPEGSIIRIGDDRIMCERLDGQYELLNDNEVCFSQVRFPKVIPDTNGSAYSKAISANVYIRQRGQSNYVLYQELEDISNQTIAFNDCDVSSFYIDILGADNGINFQTSNADGISVVVDVKTQNIKNNSILYNSAYADVLSSNGTALSHGSDIDYAGLPSAVVLESDLRDYGKKMHRSANSAEVGNCKTAMTSGHNVFFSGSFKQDEKNQRFIGTLTANASPQYGENYIYPYEIHSLSFALVLPTGMHLAGGLTQSYFTERYTLTTASGEKLKDKDAREYLFEHATITTKYNQEQQREIVIVSYDFEEPIDLTSPDMSTGSTACVFFNFPVSVSYDDYQEFGSTYTANAAIYYSNENAMGSPDTQDYDHDGDVTENVAEAVTAKATITSALSYQRDVVAHVETAQEGFSANDHQTPLDGNYSYKLRLRTASSAMSDIVIYDHIEQAHDGAKHWNGTLMGIDDSYATAKSWCDSVEKWWSPDEFAGKLGEDTSWKLIDATTKMNDVRSVAFRFKRGAASAVMPQNEMTYVLLKMKAPDVGQSHYAYNSFNADWKEISGETGAVGKQMVMPSNITRVYTEKPATYKVAVSVENGAAGMFQSGEDCEYDIDGKDSLQTGERDIPDGEKVIIGYKPKDGYWLISLKVDGEEIDTTGHNGFLELPSVTGDTRVEISFAPPLYVPETGSMNAEPLFAFIATIWVVSGIIALVLFRKYRRKDE